MTFTQILVLGPRLRRAPEPVFITGRRRLEVPIECGQAGAPIEGRRRRHDARLEMASTFVEAPRREGFVSAAAESPRDRCLTCFKLEDSRRAPQT